MTFLNTSKILGALVLGVVACYGQRPAKPFSVSADWHREPFMLRAGEVPLDTATSLKPEQWNAKVTGADTVDGNFYMERFGYAAPWLVDLTGRGVSDLVVGSFGGGFRIYKNMGSNTEPKFTADYDYLRDVSGKHMQVPIYCCIAANPRFADLDGDGILDMLSGGYYSSNLKGQTKYNESPIYWWRGLGGGKFDARKPIEDGAGYPISAYFDPERAVHREAGANFGPTAIPVFWFSNEKSPGALPDLLIGTLDGHLVVRRNIGAQGAPKFSRDFDTEVILDVGSVKALPQFDGHATVVAADWDGDGRWDILCGSQSGAVYFFRNTGTADHARFVRRQLLVAPGKKLQLLTEGEKPSRGTNSYIQVVDLNGDGKPDLLLGDYCETLVLKPDLSLQDRQRALAIKAQIDQLNLGEPMSPARLLDDDGAYKKCNELRKELSVYLVQTHRMQSGDILESELCPHGNVWVYLRK